MAFGDAERSKVVARIKEISGRFIMPGKGFDKIIGKDPGHLREKPHPDIFIKAADALGLAPAQCIALEDAQKGLTAAKKAGVPCVIVRNPLNLNCDFDEADCVLPSLAALARCLET